jgi:hypothetical protein
MDCCEFVLKILLEFTNFEAKRAGETVQSNEKRLL